MPVQDLKVHGTPLTTVLLELERRSEGGREGKCKRERERGCEGYGDMHTCLGGAVYRAALR